jgi:hypothetical protein
LEERARVLKVTANRNTHTSAWRRGGNNKPKRITSVESSHGLTALLSSNAVSTSAHLSDLEHEHDDNKSNKVKQYAMKTYGGVEVQFHLS